jgi:hypothetical protein
MKKLIIVCTLFITNQVFAQVDFRKEYYPAINRAEMAITKDDCQTAFTEYQTAFSAVKTPLARDIFNAVACKFLLNDFEGAKPLLLKLAKKGIKAEALEKQEVFMSDNIKSQWNTYKFLYEQIQSLQYEEVSVNILEKIKDFDITYDSLKANSLIFYVDKSGKHRILTYKDLKSKKVENTLTQEEANIKNMNNAKINKELFNKAQMAFVDFVIENGFESEESMFVNDSDLLRNDYAWSFDKQKVQLNFRFDGGYYVEHKPFTEVSDEKKKEFDYKILESISQGKLHRDLALKLLFGYKADNVLRFTKINIENIENCSLELKEKTYSLFYYKKTGQKLDDESQRTLEELQYGDSNLIFEKAKYKILKNSYFSMSSDVQMEETTVPNCDIAKQIIEKANIITE